MREFRLVTSPAAVQAGAGRSAATTTTITGYAAKFNVEAVIAGVFRERIAPGAFTDSLRRDDVRVLFNHSPDRVLGRVKAGTASLQEDAIGLRYKVTINPNDPLAVSVGAMVSRGDVSGASFWFEMPDPADEIWTMPAGSTLPLRTLRRLKLFDAGPVSFPAYEEATATARDIDAGQASVSIARARLALATHKR